MAHRRPIPFFTYLHFSVATKNLVIEFCMCMNNCSHPVVIKTNFKNQIHGIHGMNTTVSRLRKVNTIEVRYNLIAHKNEGINNDTLNNGSVIDNNMTEVVVSKTTVAKTIAGTDVAKDGEKTVAKIVAGNNILAKIVAG